MVLLGPRSCPKLAANTFARCRPLVVCSRWKSTFSRAKVDGVIDGIYHYNLRDHSLTLLREGRWFAELDKIMISAPFIRNANLIFFLSAVFRRTQKKVWSQRISLHSARNRTRGTESLSGCRRAETRELVYGGYTDSKLNGFLGFDGVTEAVVYSVAVGHAG